MFYELRQNKKLSLLLAVLFAMAMVLPLFNPAIANAATTNIVTATPTFTQNAGNVTLGQVWLTENTDQAGSVFINGVPRDITVTILTSGVEFRAGALPIAGAGGAAGNEANYVSPLTTLVTTSLVTANEIRFVGNGTAKTYTVRVTPNNPAGIASPRSGIVLQFPVNISGATSGPIEVEVAAPDSGITGGKFVVGNVAGAGSNAVVLDTTTVQAGAQTANTGLLRIEESVANAFLVGGVGTQIRLDLPADMTWTTGTTVNVVGPTVFNNSYLAGGDLSIGTSSAGLSRLTINIPNQGAYNTRAMITVRPQIDLEHDVAIGDIAVNVSGNNSNVTSQSVVIGKVAEIGVSVKAIGDPKSIVAGTLDAEIAGFEIIEAVRGSLLPNRTIVMELPSYVHWFAAPSITYEKGTNNMLQALNPTTRTTDDHRNIVRYNVAVAASTDATTVKFDRIRVYVDADAPAGDVVLKFSGTGGVQGELVLAKVVKPVEATGGTNEVIIGRADQKVADVVIKETAKGAAHGNPTIIQRQTVAGVAPTDRLRVVTVTGNTGWIILDAPTGVKFASKPEVDVTEGNIKINKNASELRNSDNQLWIRVSNASTVASTIKVSGINLTVDRTVPEGDLKLGITGTAFDRISVGNDVNVAEVTVAKVVTPAPSDTMAGGSGTFVIGSTTYTVDGVEKQMDVAPYIKDGRTYLPVRYVGYALGVAENNIMWDSASGTVTMIKGDKVVQVAVGSKNMIINGATIAMDAAPEINNGRTMLPFRWIAWAFGANVEWDGATQTVTIG